MAENTREVGAAGSQPEFIDIDVRVSPDRMSAHLHLCPIAGESGELTVEHLRAALAAANVARGIDVNALSSIAVDWNDNPRLLDTAVVARGAAAVPEKIGALKMQVKHLTDPLEIKLAHGCKFYWETLAFAPKFQRVDHGTVIARRSSGTPSLLGYDVFGGALLPDVEGSGTPELTNIHEIGNVFVAGGTYTASKTGIVYMDDDGLPKVIPLDFNGGADVRIEPGMMSAELTLLPAGERGSMPTEEYIRNVLRKSGVVFGINEDELRFRVARCAKDLTAPEAFVVAEGNKPIKGDDGYVEFCFNTDPSPPPVINSDGTADYKNINLVVSVGAGTVLARLHPPCKGTPGMDVTGRTLPAMNGSPVMLPVGSNTTVSPKDPASLVASRNGIVRFDGSAVNVSEGYAIPGNIDYSTGNVNCEYSVAINGDIKSGFDVNCGGDLQVNGLIEDCKVTVHGNLLCRYGFVGTGKGIVEAGGDVSMGYMKNQTLRTQGNVNIAKEAINCNIIARKSIKIYGHNLSVAGGTLITTESIIVKTVGNISGIKTLLQIDPEPEFIEELARIDAAITANEANIKKLTQTIETMPPMKRIDKDFVRKLKNAVISLKQQILALEQKKRSVTMIMNKFDNSFIRIDRCAYPGTTIKIGSLNMALSDMLTGGKTIRIIGAELRVL
jgi:hypothetical protein